MAEEQLNEQTFLFIRHGEKPEKGLGELNCQGLNRSLELPKAILAKYPQIDNLYAANPSEMKKDQGTNYSYVRPVATIEPLAVKLGKSINTQIGMEKTDDLVKEIGKQNGTTLICWEHHKIDELIKKLAKEENVKIDEKQVPHWKDNDYDSIYVLKIKKDPKNPENNKAEFIIDQEGLKPKTECIVKNSINPLNINNFLALNEEKNIVGNDISVNMTEKPKKISTDEKKYKLS